MTPSRIIVRVLLVAAFGLAAFAVGFALLGADSPSQVPWSALAAALAVVAAVLSAWTSQRIMELQEDATLPAPYPFFDFTSRYSLAQLRVTNTGSSTAFNINLDWRNPIVDHEGNDIQFPHQEGTPEIPVLAAGDSVSIPIGEAHRFMNQGIDLNYSGSITFETAKGVPHRREFFLSAEMYRKSLDYDEESVKTHFELQKVPKEIASLRQAVSGIRASLDAMRGDSPKNGNGA